jgi:uncharacterized protein (DUF488 family)
MVIYTLGHSTLQPNEFLELIAQTPLNLVWDIRSYPVSHWPWFRREEMERWLPEAGVAYRWVPELGGRRGRRAAAAAGRSIEAAPDAAGWREEGFVRYQWHTTTSEFLAAADELAELGGRRDLAIMCSEGVWWRCHRSMVADYLVASGRDAEHLQPRRVRHSAVIGDRLGRYEPAVLEAWRRHRADAAFEGGAAVGM